MQFRPGDVVTCDEHPNQVGRVEKVRRGAGMVRIRWTRNAVTWECEESLQVVTMPAPVARTSRQTQEVSR